MRIDRTPIPLILCLWVGVGIVRVLMGSNTSAVAYFFFGAFWLLSVALLVASVRQLVISRRAEPRIEALSICAALASIFAQGLLGGGDMIVAAALLFVLAVVTLVAIYARRLFRGNLIHS
jgi:succinate-acetate transporter protein